MNECEAHGDFISGLQEKSVPWKKDMTLFNAWKGLLHPRRSQNIRVSKTQVVSSKVFVCV